MWFAILLSICVGLVTTSLSNAAEYSETRDLAPLKLAANELDAILSKTHLFINAANGPAEGGSTRETVKVIVGSNQIEVPH
jgi:hypothetical protein